jgi:hypothetical protein
MRNSADSLLVLPSWYFNHSRLSSDWAHLVSFFAGMSEIPSPSKKLKSGGEAGHTDAIGIVEKQLEAAVSAETAAVAAVRKALEKGNPDNDAEYQFEVSELKHWRNREGDISRNHKFSLECRGHRAVLCTTCRGSGIGWRQAADVHPTLYVAKLFTGEIHSITRKWQCSPEEWDRPEGLLSLEADLLTCSLGNISDCKR